MAADIHRRRTRVLAKVEEAPLRHDEKGLVPEGRVGTFPEFGINVRVLQPGQPAAMYHREGAQEAFLALSGECVVIVEEEERPMRKGDFLHLPPGVSPPQPATIGPPW
jgi:uncharacterized cupin superfamily protein